MSKDKKSVEAIRKIAMCFPETVEGTSCANVTFSAGKKNFLFVGANDETYNIRLKLGDSLGDAEKLANQQPDRYKPGMHGWTQLVFPHGQRPPAGVLERWIEESFRLIAPKNVAALLPTFSGKKPVTSAASKPAKKKALPKTAKKKQAAGKASGKKPPKKAKAKKSARNA